MYIKSLLFDKGVLFFDKCLIIWETKKENLDVKSKLTFFWFFLPKKTTHHLFSKRGAGRKSRGGWKMILLKNIHPYCLSYFVILFSRSKSLLLLVVWIGIFSKHIPLMANASAMILRLRGGSFFSSRVSSLDFS